MNVKSPAEDVSSRQSSYNGDETDSSASHLSTKNQRKTGSINSHVINNTSTNFSRGTHPDNSLLDETSGDGGIDLQDS